jgi:probable phosphoglycerate mutase
VKGCILLVRHGETEWNVQRRNQGRFDSPLTERGVAQAEAIGRLIKTLPDAAVARIVASPLGRARRTAEIIRSHIEPVPDLLFDERLRELSLGSWDGLTYDEIAICSPGIFEGDRGREWCFRSPDGEGFERFAARLGEWLSEALEAPFLVAVTHGIVSRILRGLYAGLAREVMLTLPVPQNKIFQLCRGAIQELVVAPAVSHTTRGGPYLQRNQHLSN